jgi:hypothetical protein
MYNQPHVFFNSRGDARGEERRGEQSRAEKRREEKSTKRNEIRRAAREATRPHLSFRPARTTNGGGALPPTRAPRWLKRRWAPLGNVCDLRRSARAAARRLSGRHEIARVTRRSSQTMRPAGIATAGLPRCAPGFGGWYHFYKTTKTRESSAADWLSSLAILACDATPCCLVYVSVQPDQLETMISCMYQHQLLIYGLWLQHLRSHPASQASEKRWKWSHGESLAEQQLLHLSDWLVARFK